MASSWTLTSPIDHTKISQIPQEIRNLKYLLKSRLLYQAAEPAKRLDEEAFVTADLGSIWIDSDNDQMSILTAIGPPLVWTLVYTDIAEQMVAAAHTWAELQTVDGGIDGGEDADITLNTDKFTVDAETGNTVVAGSLTLASLAGDGFLDEDDMASDAADKAASQQSIKKYVDDTVAAEAFSPDPMANGFTTLDTNTASFSKTITFPNGLILHFGYDKDPADMTIDISGASFTAVYAAWGSGYDLDQTTATRCLFVHTLTTTSLGMGGGEDVVAYDGLFYAVLGR